MEFFMSSEKQNDASPSPLHPIAQLYRHWTFNFMVDAASAIADDFAERPDRYRGLPRDVSDAVSGFSSLLGSHPDWPDATRRTSIFRGMLSTVCLASPGLREAALVYVEQGSERKQEILLETFREAAAGFGSQMETIEGQSVDLGCSQVGAILNNAIKIFKSDELTRVFGLNGIGDEKWPMGGYFSGPAAHTAAEVIRSLEAINVARASAGGPNKPLNISISSTKFILLQRVAYYGGLAISDILTASAASGDPYPGVGNTYKWTKALQRLVPDVVRVWKDRNYRLRLTDVEWGMVDPHPVGEIRLPGFPAALAAQTYTVHGEICCCSGALNCSSNCQVSPGPSCINCGSLDMAARRPHC